MPTGKKIIFVTSTDTGVGKTMTTLVLATLLKARGHSVGVIKPVQCSGDDAQFLKKRLKLDDDLAMINPCYAPEPLSPHLALRRAGCTFQLAKVKKALAHLQQRYDIMLVEGAGGLMVPLTARYYNADLIRDLNAEAIIVARLGLGTINHTLLTIRQAQAYGLAIQGIIFSAARRGIKTIPEQTNPGEIARLSGIKVLGIIPYLTSFSETNILKQCRTLTLSV